jgi:hypothetical protein
MERKPLGFEVKAYVKIRRESQEGGGDLTLSGGGKIVFPVSY